MRAEDIMSSPVITVRPDTPVTAAAALLTTRGLTALPVIDEEDRLIGIFTGTDLMRARIVADPCARIWRKRDGIPRSKSSTVGEVMTTPAMSMTRTADVAELAKVMLEDQVRCIPITDDSTVVGIVTRHDLVRAATRG